MIARAATHRMRPEAKNFLALVVIQGSNALVPLLIVPWALVQIGADEYAVVAITEAVMALVLAAVLFSFEVDGVARIAALPERTDRAALSVILSEVLAARAVMFLLAAPVALALYASFGGGGVTVLAFWLLVPLGNILHSYWFYQGVEDNMPAAAITLTCRMATVAVTVLFIDGPGDGVLIPVAIGGPFVLAGMVSIGFLIHHYGLTLHWPGLRRVLAVLRHGKEIFGGNMAVTLYRDLNVLILGVAGASAAAISVYALVEKWVKMLQAVSRPLSQLFFPKVLRALVDQVAPTPAAARIVVRYTVPQVAIVAAALGALAVAAVFAVPHAPVLRELFSLPHAPVLAAIMAPVAVIGMANFMFGSAALNALGARGYLFGAIGVTGAINVVACYLLARQLGGIGAALAFLGAECLLLMLILTRYRHRPTGPGRRVEDARWK